MTKKVEMQFLEKNLGKRDFVKKGELLSSFLKTCSYMLTNNSGSIKASNPQKTILEYMT